jgi:hypothetical protein
VQDERLGQEEFFTTESQRAQSRAARHAGAEGECRSKSEIRGTTDALILPLFFFFDISMPRGGARCSL